MILIIPIASPSKFFNIDDYGYPQYLIEIMGKPMIQYVVENLCNENLFKKIIFIVKDEDCRRYHIDNTLKLITPIEPTIIKLKSDTMGALCSVLLAIELIDDGPLVISNGDQIIDDGVSTYIKNFLSDNHDAGCLTFSSVHPRWSYVRTDENSFVIETAEKNPISQDAIAGIYFYRSGQDFTKLAMKSIKNRASTDGKYFISSVFNEYILDGYSVVHFPIKNSKYHTLYNPQKIEEFELFFNSRIV
jgi:dTDP-glucose pyrophosphorylase